MKEYNLVYNGPQFKNINIKPFRINESTSEELFKIRYFFNQNKNTFYFLFKKKELIGATLYLQNYIQSLCINRKYQKMGYGTKLTKFVVNKILSDGHDKVTLKVMNENFPALELYKKLGFEIDCQ